MVGESSNVGYSESLFLRTPNHTQKTCKVNRLRSDSSPFQNDSEKHKNTGK